MASEYFTTTPEMKAPIDVAAAAGGNYGSFQAPIQEHNISGHDEGNVIQYERQDEVGHYQQENGGNEFNHGDEAHKEGVATDDYEVSTQQEHEHVYTQSEEQNHRDSEQQYVQRRGYQNQRGGRGGGRRGFNGRGFRGGSRGGGPYQNGRNQYYDQPGNYYPRNNYNNGRGRGGRGSGGQGYNQYGVNPHSSHHAGDVGVAS